MIPFLLCFSDRIARLISLHWHVVLLFLITFLCFANLVVVGVDAIWRVGSHDYNKEEFFLKIYILFQRSWVKRICFIFFIDTNSHTVFHCVWLPFPRVVSSTCEVFFFVIFFLFLLFFVFVFFLLRRDSYDPYSIVEFCFVFVHCFFLHSYIQKTIVYTRIATLSIYMCFKVVQVALFTSTSCVFSSFNICLFSQHIHDFVASDTSLFVFSFFKVSLFEFFAYFYFVFTIKSDNRIDHLKICICILCQSLGYFCWKFIHFYVV